MAGPTIVFAGGGTGGHLFPALAIADELRRQRRDVRIVFIGTTKRLEARVVPQRGYEFHTIWIGGWKRGWSLDHLLFPLKVLVACVQSFILMTKLKPGVVIGTGGYVCGPPLFVASLLGIPTVIQEQNSFPGITTRLLAARATEVHLAFEESRRYLRRQDNVVVSGNPTGFRDVLSRTDALDHFRLVAERKTLLVFGGSLGASSINRAVASNLAALRSLGVQLIWQTGEQDFERMNELVRQHRAHDEEPYVRVLAFIHRMHEAYSACDLAVCRAGATTLAELTSLGVPAILVPYPFAAADHQRKNAEMLVRHNAAVMIEDARLQEHLVDAVKEILSDEQRRVELARNARLLGKPQAAETLARAVLHLAGA